MAPVSDWLPPLTVGLTFTSLGGLKLFGLARGMVGGRGKPFFVYLCGT